MRRVVQLVQPHRPKAATVAWEAPGAGQSKSPIGPLGGLTPEQHSSGHWSNRLSTATPQQGCTKESVPKCGAPGPVGQEMRSWM